MTILAIDTSSQWCSVAIYLDKHNYFYQHELLGNSASQKLLDFVQAVLDQAKICLDDVSTFACSQGPGAFTGIRLGIGVSQGLAYAQGKPLVAIPSLDGMVAYKWLMHPEFFQSDSFMAAIDARMNQIYLSEYQQVGNNLPVRFGPIYLQDNIEQIPSVKESLLAYQCSQYAPFISNFKSVIEGVPHALGIAYQASLIDSMANHYPQDCQPLYVRDKVAQTTLERSQTIRL
jgi:tRNA threonylcarbamoyladenosine biosynthesis protein TsaB